MTMDSKWFRGLLFGSIYFIQGAILTYFSGFNALYLRSFNLSFSQIGIASGIALIPFVLKVIIGMLSDRVSPFGLGHRRPYMVAGILLQSMGAFVLPLINPLTSFGAYIAVLSLVSLGMSTYDTASDGLAIDTTPEDERGFVQGVMVGARALAAIVLATAMGFLVSRYSWAAAFVFVGVVTLLPLVLVLRATEGQRSRAGAFSLAGLRAFLALRMGMFLLLGLVYPLVLYSANGVIGAFLNERVGITMLQVGMYTSLFGVGAVVGGLTGGAVTDRLGLGRSILLALIITSLSLLALAASASPAVAAVAVLMFGVAFGYYETAYQAAGMGFVDPRVAATMFAVIMAVGNIGIGLGQPLAGALVDSFGFQVLFLVLSVLNLATLPLVALIFRRGQNGEGLLG